MGFLKKQHNRSQPPQATTKVDPNTIPDREKQEDLNKLLQHLEDVKITGSSKPIVTVNKPKLYGSYDPSDSLKIENPFRGV